jgi:hypothetical protein
VRTALIMQGDVDGVMVYVSRQALDEAIAVLRIAQTPCFSELEDANTACIELAAKHGYATGHGDTVADMIREFSAQIPSVAQAKPDCGAKEAIKALMDDRRVALGSSHRKRLAAVMAALSPAVWPSGCHDPDSCVRHLACMYVQCARHGNDGNEVAAEISACSVPSTQLGCGDPSCKDPECTYGKGPNTDPLSSTNGDTP